MKKLSRKALHFASSVHLQYFEEIVLNRSINFLGYPVHTKLQTIIQ